MSLHVFETNLHVARPLGASKKRQRNTTQLAVAMNSESVEETKATVDAMPLANGGFLGFEYIPVGPLKPLGLLLQGK